MILKRWSFKPPQKNNVVIHPTIYLQNYNVTADSPLKLDTMGKELVEAG